MSEEKLRKVFAKNLKRQLDLHGKQPVDLVSHYFSHYNKKRAEDFSPAHILKYIKLVR